MGDIATIIAISAGAVTIVLPALNYFASRRGAEDGMKVAIAEFRVRLEALERRVDDNDSRLWDQIGRNSTQGMRVLVHNSTPMGAHVELEHRVSKLEGR